MYDVETMRDMIGDKCADINCADCPANIKGRFCNDSKLSKDCDEVTLREWFSVMFPECSEQEKTPKTRADFLKTVEGIICKDRNEQYGEPEDNFKRIAVFWSNYLDREITSADVAIMMVLFKAARIASGHNKEDNWVDLIGYGACGAECAVREK